jgi:hypothetical protein
MARIALICGAVVLTAILLLVACEPQPTGDKARLRAVRAEAQMLMATGAPQGDRDVPKQAWPQTIAALHPEFVWVGPEGVEIMTRPYFDGGWGYFVPRDPRRPPTPEGRFEQAGEGVYWHHPY